MPTLKLACLIRAAIQDGGDRGGVDPDTAGREKYLPVAWRSWVRKLEAFLTPWWNCSGQKRILEVYLNVAEFDEGVFGAEAASALFRYLL